MSAPRGFWGGVFAAITFASVPVGAVVMTAMHWGLL